MQWLRFLIGRKRHERDLDDEVQADLEMEAKERIDSGQDPQQAWAAARREFGNVTLAKEATREAWGSGWLERLAQDLKYSSRMLRRSPGFTLVTVLILTLGIGALTAVFSLLNGVVLRMLPVRRPEELVMFTKPSFSYPIFQEVQARQNIFSGLFAWDIQRLNAGWNRDLAPATVLLVTGEFYSALSVRPVRGRLLGPEDDALVAVISHSVWAERFNYDPAIAGKTVRVERAEFTIIGVTPPEFFGPAVGMAPEITIPVTAAARLNPRNAGILTQASSAWLHMMGRLRPGISVRQANSALQVFWPRIMEVTTHPGMPEDRRARYLSRTTELVPAAAGHSRIRNQFAQPLWILFGLVALLLLIGCGTLANLFLAKSSARRKEIALRIALGASRGRIARQLLLEGVMVTAIGAMLGLVFAMWASDILVALLSTSRLPIALTLDLNWRVLGFSTAAAAITALTCSALPALHSSRIDPGPAIKEMSRSFVPGRQQFGKLLVVAQVSLSMLLVAGAALFARSLHGVLSTDAGFDRENVLIVGTDPVAAGYEGRRLPAFYTQLLERLRALPGVESASLSWVPPVSNEMGSWTQSVSIDGAPVRLDERTTTYFNAVSPGYFQTLGTPLLRGRDFGAQDNESGPRTVIVNESLANAFFPNQDPLGRRISIGIDSARQDLRIIGIAKDAKYQRLQEPARRIAYLPYLQLPELIGGSNLLAELRTSARPEALGAAVRHEVRSMDASVPVRLETLEQRVRESLVNEWVIATISAFLALIAVLLASAGLYGVIAYGVARRTSEIGIRMALGARQSGVVWMVLREALLLASGGIGIGVAASGVFGKFVSALLHGVLPSDAVALSIAAATLLGVALIAAGLPARRAARIDPAAALRAE